MAADTLDQVEQALQTLRISPGTTQANEGISTLAQASRTHPSVRGQLADPEILQVLIETVECSVHDSVETASTALRCIGNACIDDDGARAAVVAHGLRWMRPCLHRAGAGDAELRAVAVKVLYNVCTDYEPAQQQAFRDRIHYDLITMGDEFARRDGAEQGLFVDLLFWITGQSAHVEPGVNGELPSDVLTALLEMPNESWINVDDFATLIECCLVFWRDAKMQEQIVGARQAEQIWRVLEKIERTIGGPLPSNGADDGESEAEKLLVALSTSTTWSLSDIAAQPLFAVRYRLDDEWIHSLLNLIDASNVKGNERMVTAACQIVGNMLWALAPGAAVAVAETDSLHRSLWSTFVNGESNADLKHSAAGLLTQLARQSIPARERIGADDNAPVALEHLCRDPVPQLQQDGIKLLKALGNECPSNQRRFEDLARAVMSSPTDTTVMEQG